MTSGIVTATKRPRDGTPETTSDYVVLSSSPEREIIDRPLDLEVGPGPRLARFLLITIQMKFETPKATKVLATLRTLVIPGRSKITNDYPVPVAEIS